MMWSSVQFVGFDTETTGRDPLWAEIVTAAVGEREWLLKPTAPIPAEATDIHGISTQTAMAEGVDHARGVAEIREAIDRVWADGGALCVFNAAYDCTLLDRECRRHGLGGFEIRGVVIDPLVIDKQADRYRRGKRQLINVAEHHGVALPAEAAHGARADAAAAAGLGEILARHVVDPAVANEVQAGWHDEQLVSFADWLRGKGDPARAAEVLAERGWPLRNGSH